MYITPIAILLHGTAFLCQRRSEIPQSSKFAAAPVALTADPDGVVTLIYILPVNDLGCAVRKTVDIDPISPCFDLAFVATVNLK